VVGVGEFDPPDRAAVGHHGRPGAVEAGVAEAVGPGQQQRLVGAVLRDRIELAVQRVQVALEVRGGADPAVVE
jgi:hypothetical protein